MRISVVNVKIDIKDTINAAKAMCQSGSGECKIVAAGSIYATISTDYRDRQALVKAKINWSVDA